MSEREQAKTPDPIQPGEPGEHPLSVLVFSWMRSKLFFRGLTAMLAMAGAALIALEFVFVRRAYLSIDGVPGFFGAFGFIAFALAVLSGWPLGKLMRRPEDYYEKVEGRDDR
jgi:hypothetical protein